MLTCVGTPEKMPFTLNFCHWQIGNSKSYLKFVESHHIYHKNVSFSEVIKQKGLENVTVDDLVAEITPQGRGDQ